MSDFTAKKADIIKEFSQKDYDYIVNGKKVEMWSFFK